MRIQYIYKADETDILVKAEKVLSEFEDLYLHEHGFSINNKGVVTRIDIIDSLKAGKKRPPEIISALYKDARRKKLVETIERIKASMVPVDIKIVKD